MSREVELWSFADVDRSGKVRWTARELEYDIVERRLEVGTHLQDEYLAVNAYGQIPAVRVDGEVLIESTAICLSLAERHPASGLVPQTSERREAFWRTMGIATQTLELPVVNYYLSQVGFADPSWTGLIGDNLRRQIGVFAARAPEQAFWLGEFTLADIFAAYVLRIGITAGLLERSGVLGGYIDRLMARPAAVEARFFDSLSE